MLNVYPYYPYNHTLYPISNTALFQNIPAYLNSRYQYFYHTLRFFLINVWLSKYGKHYNSILLCDIRDIIFQADPFSFTKIKGLYLQQEAYSITATGINYKWIKPYHPNNSILSKLVINSGQIIGNSIEITKFVNRFCDFMNKSSIHTAEQGSLNYFIYSNLYKEKSIILKYGYGYSLLLHRPLIKHKDIHTPIKNYIYNLDGSIPPILHGYDIGLKVGSENRKKLYTKFINYHAPYNIQHLN